MLHKEYLHLLVLFGIATCMAQKQFNTYAAVKRKKFKSVYSSVGSLSRIECALRCGTESRCAAFQYCHGSSSCSFSDVGGQFSAYLDDSADCNVYTKSKPESDQQQGGGGQGGKSLNYLLPFELLKAFVIEAKLNGYFRVSIFSKISKTLNLVNDVDRI